MMQTGTNLVKLFAFVLVAGLATGTVNAQNYGDSCDPGAAIGYTARMGAIEGTVYLFDGNDNPLSVQTGSIVPAGASIETTGGAQAELLIEDGTDARQSKVTLSPGSLAKFHGGLFCDDLRPIRDDGIWTSRNFNAELSAGTLQLELAESVSYSFSVTIETKNAKIDLRQGRQERAAIEVSAGGLDNRQLVPVMEHPVISRHISGMLFGQSMDDLSERNRRDLKKQAVITAIHMGFLDLDDAELFDDPQIKSMMNMVTGGKSFNELDDQERQMMAQLAGTMMLESGRLNPDEVTVYNQPDERTVISVHARSFRVYNTHGGYHRDKVVQLDAGMMAEIDGYGEPLFQ